MTSREKAYEDASRVRESLQDSDQHQAYGWATATCGRIDAYRGFHLRADALLAEAYGRLFIANDRYGIEMVTSHLAIPQVLRGQLARAVELALHPLNSDVPFTDLDRSLLHNVAAICYSERQEFHGAVFQLNKEYELIKKLGDYARVSVVLGNLGTILIQIGAWELALAASTEAWKLQLEHCKDRSELQFTHVANIVCANVHLNRLDSAREHARELMNYLESAELPAHWVMRGELAVLFARLGDVRSAKRHLERARALAQGFDTAGHLETVGMILLEAEGKYSEAIKAARSQLSLCPERLVLGQRIVRASLLQRCCRALGDEVEARKWQQFQEESSRSVLLGDMLISQMRSNLNVRQLINPLTDKELTCLRLSAHGQTSADIGLKLGMKTRTVNFHFSNILRKLNAMNRQEAIAKAVSANLLKRD